MGCRGVHFAITEQEAIRLRLIAGEQERLDFLQNELEESYFDEFTQFIAESDKAWDAIHRSLADGQLTYDAGSYPLNHAVLAGEILYTSSDYIMSLKSPDQVHDIAAGLESIDELEFRRRYFSIDSYLYGCELSEDDFCYTWQWFQKVRDLYRRATDSGRYVLFTADQ